MDILAFDPSGLPAGSPRRGFGRHLLGALLLALLCASMPPMAHSAEEDGVLRFGVFAYLGEEATRRQYQPIVDYLNQRLAPQRVVLEVLPQAEIDRRVAEGSLDIVTTNPTHFLHARVQQPLTGVIATLVESYHGQPLKHYGGVIFTRSTRDGISALEDVGGKIIGYQGLENLGSYGAQAYELLQAGVELPGDARKLIEFATQQEVVHAVLKEHVEVGFVRCGVLERMRDQGELRMQDIRVIHPLHHPDHPTICSTRLYPNWPMFALPHVDEALVRRVAAALFLLEPEDSAAREAGIYGYTIPADYLPAEELSRALHLPPYDKVEDMTLADAWQHWRAEIIISGLSLLSITLLLLRLTVLMRREKRLRMQHERLLSSLGEGVYGTDERGLCTFINEAALQMLGVSREEVLGHNQHELFHHHYPDGRPYPQDECPIEKTVRDGIIRRGEEWFFRRSGEGFPVFFTVAPLCDDHKISGTVVVFRDITELKRLERELREQATTDPLTRLPNRRYFFEALERELARIQRTQKTACLLMLDLDLFKRVNDQYGHAAGDHVLIMLADVLRANLRQQDMAGRIGGEEFAVLLPDTDQSRGLAVAERLRAAVEEAEVRAGDHLLKVTVSIGCVEMRPGDLSVNTALERADLALYRAKEGGRNRVVLGS